LSRDILALVGPTFEECCCLYDFIVAELSLWEPLNSARIRLLRIALERQRNQLLRFASVLDTKLDAIVEQFNVNQYRIQALCLLQRKPKTSAAYWQRRDQINNQLGSQCHAVFDAVILGMDDVHRSSSRSKTNVRLRTYFFLRSCLDQGYLELLRFYLNHRTFMHSRKPEGVDKSSKQLMTNQLHSHWLELLGFVMFRRPSAIR